MTETREYRPGYCNIGRYKRRQRLRVALLGFAVAGAYVVAYLAGFVPGPLLVAVFVPLSVGFEWGLQAYTSFCVRLALLNRYDLRGSGGTTGDVSRPDARHADQVQALKISVAAVVSAAALTALLVVLL